MSKLLPVLFVAILAAVFGGMDFYMQKQKAGDQPFGLTDYLAARQIAVAAISSPPSLEKAMPQQLPGWTIHRFEAEDLSIITARAPSPQEAEDFAKTRQNEKLGLTLTPSAQLSDLAMYKGDTALRLVATLILDDGSMASGALMAQNKFMKGMIEGAAPGQTGTGDFAMVDGVTFVELPKDPDSPEGTRRLRATLGDAATVTAVTRSTDDATIAQALASVDFVMLNSLLKAPLPNVANSPVILASDQTAAPEEPSALAKIMQKSSGTQEVADAGNTTDASTEPGPAAPQKACVRRAGKLNCPKN